MVVFQTLLVSLCLLYFSRYIPRKRRLPAHQLGTPLPLAAKFDTSKQEATNYAFPDPRALGVRLGSFWVSLAPMPVGTCRKCCWLLLTVLCVSVCFILCLRR